MIECECGCHANILDEKSCRQELAKLNVVICRLRAVSDMNWLLWLSGKVLLDDYEVQKQ